MANAPAVAGSSHCRSSTTSSSGSPADSDTRRLRSAPATYGPAEATVGAASPTAASTAARCTSTSASRLPAGSDGYRLTNPAQGIADSASVARIHSTR